MNQTPLSPSIVQKFFLGTFSLYTQMGRGVARRDTAHVTPKVKLCMHTIFLVIDP